MFNIGQVMPFLEYLTMCCCDEEEEKGLISHVKSADMGPLISMPKLDVKKLKTLPSAFHTDQKLVREIGSQGFFVSSDGSCAYSHESSVPHFYFENVMNVPCFINMDRGGIVTRADGTQAACIGDGVSGDGYCSAFVAHLVCQYLLNRLSQEVFQFSDNSLLNKQLVEEVFRDCARGISKPNMYLGCTTVAFVECVPTRKKKGGKQQYFLHVGALGDSAVIHIDSHNKKAVQLNEIYRKNDSFGKPDKSSTGGSIAVCNKISSPKNIVAKVYEVSEDDYIVLVTDGFLDNVRDERIEEMVALVAYQPFFDQPFEELLRYNRFWEKQKKPLLPTVEDIQMYVEGYHPDERPTPAQLTQRLANYTKLVTYSASLLEENNDDIAYSQHFPKTDDAMIITLLPIANKF